MKIVVLDGGTLNPGDLSWDIIAENGAIEVYNNTNESEIINRSIDAEILIVNKIKLTPSILDSLPNLKYIAISATGYDNVDIAYCNKINIPVSHVKGYGSANVAQHVFALILALTNRVKIHHNLIQEGEWLKQNAFSFWDAPIIELAEKTIGIIGWGNIGQKVGAIAAGFEMKVIYYSASNKKSSFAENVELDELIKTSDFISLNTHLTDSNNQLVNANFLSNMKKSAFLINTSRGGLIDENALALALKSNQIAGAGLDVLSKEPPLNDHPLLHLENCIVTPHNAWATVEARQRMMNILNQNIQSFINGNPINLITE